MNGPLDTFELQILWEGVEHFTGLWDVEVLARREHELSGVTPRDRARLALGRLAERGLIAIYTCRGIPTDETCVQVGVEKLSNSLEANTSWEAPGEGQIGIWYDTTEEGFVAYREVTGWDSP